MVLLILAQQTYSRRVPEVRIPKIELRSITNPFWEQQMLEFGFLFCEQLPKISCWLPTQLKSLRVHSLTKTMNRKK
ncbi:CLUMA_CG013883, isoform A [Clunio marinus]|uniref:CLUMA_CG013883, isoform A n=1 Tax=Clunio marinus TaxID=568069 RepID=A0A1J1IK56_9DIPT|nr:CLUMA_CG013883, isoform A [Clunio marinus]